MQLKSLHCFYHADLHRVGARVYCNMKVFPCCKTAVHSSFAGWFSAAVNADAVEVVKGSKGPSGGALTHPNVPFKAVALQQLANAVLASRKVCTLTAAVHVWGVVRTIKHSRQYVARFAKEIDVHV